MINRYNGITEGVVRAAYRLREAEEIKLIDVSTKNMNKKWAHQVVLPTPMRSMGEQIRPTWAGTPWRTIPSSLSTTVTSGADADWTELQHSRLLMLHSDKVVAEVAVAVAVTVLVTAGVVVGVATARRGKSARAVILGSTIVC